MPRLVNKLSARKVATLTQPGRHSDGGGLYLSISPSGARSWVFMWKVAGRRREMGLGPLQGVPLQKAREKAANARQLVLEGRDPLAARDAQQSQMTFGEAADALIESMSPSWRNEKHRAQWTMTLTAYCQQIRSKPVAEITTDDVLAVLEPIWRSKSETASRLRGRIERVLSFAKARGMRSGENPAQWRGHLDAILPKRPMLTRGHHKALPFQEVPAFMRQLREMEGIAPRALEFAIVTAARSGEVFGLTWSELSLDDRLWIVPGPRMKGGREHRVPLTSRAVQILLQMGRLRTEESELVFPGGKRGRQLSETSLQAVLERMGVDATPHGFRSSFRDWAGDATSFPREVAEAALAHIVGDKAERAYRRGDALEKRRKLMEAWQSYCQGTTPRRKTRSAPQRASPSAPD
ncbi:tyrosine-type recombinase/integrase [Bradyrhizobium sp. 149]|uniref:tyrosine-type recombinase/integrase n=1 Tax=Bradyrhizobium sp. 149 TaxID=2782624 RepID=UPI001FFA265D|nr:site-specific integrase [Bradyrhizobium sp. 149]MCK1650091.1 tyrosine-type recombinase/integrase [Bradyrhizobium sp. 149]